MSGGLLSTRFAHPALFYRSDDDYQAKIVPFVTEGLDFGQSVAVSVPGAGCGSSVRVSARRPVT